MSEIMYKEFLLKEIFEPHQGNAIYTKKAIISNGWEGNVPVISSDTNNNGILCYISNEYVKKKDYIDYPCITWTVDGQAGTFYVFVPFYLLWSFVRKNIRYEVDFFVCSTGCFF